MAWQIRFAVLLGVVLIVTPLATAFQTKSDKSEKASVQRTPKERPAFTPEREAAALTFVRLNHSELADLLAQLKASNSSEYERAIRELFQTSETLAETKTRDQHRYEIERRAWVVNSRVRVLAARMAMTRSPSLDDDLKRAVTEQVDIRVQHLVLERDRLQSRLQKVESDIASIQQSRDREVEKRLSRYLNSVRKAQGNVRVVAQPSTPKKSSSDSVSPGPKR